MSVPLEKYLDGIESARVLTNATEHTYRGFLAQLISHLAPECTAVNEPKRSECGAPDYVVMESATRFIRGYIEAKDIGVSLDDAAKSEQLSRYLRSLPNLLLTDYLEFRWYVEGKLRRNPIVHFYETFLAEAPRTARRLLHARAGRLLHREKGHLRLAQSHRVV